MILVTLINQSSIKGRFALYDTYPLPLEFAWTGSRGILWGGRKLSKDNGGRGLVIAGWLDQTQKPVLSVGINGEQKSIEIETDIDYAITLKWYGEIDGHKMDDYENSYILRFDGMDLF